MELDDRRTIQTPEGLELDLTLAGLGSRMIAAVVDAIIVGLALLGLGLAVGSLIGTGADDLLVAGLSAVAISIVVLGYFAGFEAFNEGRTLGKRSVGIRVVTMEGDSIGFLAAFLRNLLRLVDFLPLIYVVGSITILTTRTNQRLGDIAANTIVIRERLPGLDDAGLEPMESTLPRWDVSRVSDDDINLIRRFATRRRSLPADRVQQIAAQIAAKIRPKVSGERADEVGDTTFLLWVLSQKTR